jgi:tetratricopeptide (TPR) repeat protein
MKPLACSLIGLLLTTGFVSAVNETTSSTEARPQMSLSDARQSLTHALQQATLGYYTPLEEIQVTNTEFSFRNPSREGGVPAGKYSYQFGKIQHLAVLQDGRRYRINFSPFAVCWKSKDDAQRFVDAIETIKYHFSGRALTGDAALFADFQEKAKTWRALPTKPPLPEEVRRFKVLAEDAFQKKEFEKAAGYYEQGLAIEPLCPDGQLNAALFYGELEMNAQAVLHMRRYLELCPDAKDAKKCRNQMYIWQEKIK